MTLLKITINGVEIPLEKICDFCDGTGKDLIIDDHIHLGDCHHCNGTGKTWIYYTPGEIEELTGSVLPNNAIVFVLDKLIWKEELYYFASGKNNIVVKIKGQPKPPENWRPEK